MSVNSKKPQPNGVKSMNKNLSGKNGVKKTLSNRQALIGRNFKNQKRTGLGANMPTNSSSSSESSAKSSLASIVNAKNNDKVTSSTTSQKSTVGNVKVNLEQKNVDLVLKRIAPASAAKIGFFISIAFGLVLIVAGILFWLLLDKSGILVQLASTFAGAGIGQSNSSDSFSLDKVVLICALIGCLNCVLITLLSVVIAYIYNTASALAGGLKLSFTRG